jgi:hypothetical protein
MYAFSQDTESTNFKQATIYIVFIAATLYKSLRILQRRFLNVDVILLRTTLAGLKPYKQVEQVLFKVKQVTRRCLLTESRR